MLPLERFALIAAIARVLKDAKIVYLAMLS